MDVFLAFTHRAAASADLLLGAGVTKIANEGNFYHTDGPQYDIPASSVFPDTHTHHRDTLRLAHISPSLAYVFKFKTGQLSPLLQLAS